MKPFAAPSFTIEAPDAWTDATTYMLLGPVMGGAHVSMLLSITHKVSQPNVTAFVESQLPDLKKLPGYVAVGHNHTKVKTFDTVIL